MSAQQDNKGRVARISLRPTHGTAKPAAIESILPAEKAAREVFWVQTLVAKIDEYSDATTEICANPDDSHGGSDVFVHLKSGAIIGVQVTELTYEIQRRRSSIRERYINRVLGALSSERLASTTSVVVQLLVTAEPGERLDFPPKKLVELIRQNLDDLNGPKRISLKVGHLLIQPVSGDLYIPSVGNIGFDVNFDQIPFTVDTYTHTIDRLADKKSGAKSPWLLIWSLDFWRDRHCLGNQIVAYMKEVFADSHFQRVFFAESLDGCGLFEANLTVYRIKG